MYNEQEEAGKKNSQNSAFQLWQQDNHPIELYNPKTLHQKLDYIHHNPVAAEIVENAEDYLYSSARTLWLFGLDGYNVGSPVNAIANAPEMHGWWRR